MKEVIEKKKLRNEKQHSKQPNNSDKMKVGMKIKIMEKTK